MKKILLVLFIFIYSFSSNGQTADKKWNIGLHFGSIQYNGDLSNDFYSTNQAFYGFGGLSVSHYVGSHFDINLQLTKGEIGHSDFKAKFFSGITTGTLNFRFNMTRPEAIVRPYLFAGGGLMMFSVNPTGDKSKSNFVAPSFGAGFNFKLNESVNFQIQETFLYSGADDVDDKIEKSNDLFLQHMVGFTFNFGNKKDADGDGVADRNDKCPSTPKDVKVDLKGCPLDNDKDGLADYLDACPNDSGSSSLKGCPDRDKDEVADKDDDCPDVKGPVNLKGCPDTDLDGIADVKDKCPDTKQGYKVDLTGCPMDRDRDGVVNEEDVCPDSSGTVAMKGCPDTDGDGIANNVDRCPYVVGTLANRGCPEITKEDIKKITQIASKIFFETDSDKLKVASLSQLDELVIILKRYDAANLTIEGHTDNVGEDAYNLTLSQKRTESVKNYLTTNGILESRLIAIGYGETKPIADNTTSIGRAKNRRVELKTEF